MSKMKKNPIFNIYIVQKSIKFIAPKVFWAQIGENTQNLTKNQSELAVFKKKLIFTQINFCR